MPGEIITSRGNQQSDPDFLDKEVDAMVQQNRDRLEEEGDRTDETGSEMENVDDVLEDDAEDEDGEMEDDGQEDDGDDEGEDDGVGANDGDDEEDDNEEEVEADEDITDKKNDKNKKNSKKGESVSSGNRDKRIKDLQSKTTKATTKAANLKKEVARLQAVIDSTDKTDGKVVKAASVAVDASQDAVKDLAKSFSDAEKEYPELVGPLKKVMAGIQDQITAIKTGLLDQGKVVSEVQVSSSENAHWSKVERDVSDYDRILKSVSFEEYVDSLKPRLKKSAMETIKDGTATDFIDLLKDFKDTEYYAIGDAQEQKKKVGNKKEKTKKEALLDQARKVVDPSFKKSKSIKTKSGKKVITRRELKGMPKHGFDSDEEEKLLDEAIIAGNFRR